MIGGVIGARVNVNNDIVNICYNVQKVVKMNQQQPLYINALLGIKWWWWWDTRRRLLNECVPLTREEVGG